MTQPSCFDCAHSFGTEYPYCGAPQLGDLLDQTHERNMSTPCDGARDFHFACGHKARWFTPRPNAGELPDSSA